ncbi:MAG: ImmA/IrrE family metallo-endopeptidase [Planctomycetes bacterium]|nr:ImmA/IrrE family metallo-endopeptidase [Planctomycetota bacterium]MBL7143035.1 ImmA/IrrE family metallo-endopeptidase [Phycisphaerae bacterium]
MTIKATSPEVKQIIDDLQDNVDLPIDLDKIINNEGNIRTRPANYGNKFDGRIEYISDKNIFILYHPKLISPRVRFSIAHELGHFYIPEHRKLLLSGKSHNSKAGFISNKRLEREADEFASHLLVPESYLNELLFKKTFLTLKDLLKLANELQVSATAMTIRYVKMTPEPCAVILSQEGQQKFYLASEEMEYTGFQWRGCKDIPWNSASAKASKNQGSGEVFEEETDSGVWFSKRKRERKIWEEAFPLGYTGLVLTLLSDPSYNG